MPQGPEAFATDLNRLCIEMTHTRRGPGSLRARKGILRRFKPLLRTIAGHARRHRDRLASEYAQGEEDAGGADGGSTESGRFMLQLGESRFGCKMYLGAVT